jgi:transcription-repair coupling factor (superfamily II helicase)
MNTVGFDLYTRLLADAIAAMQGERRAAPPPPTPVTVELPVAAFIPDEYINDRTLKLHFYQRLANLERPEAVEAMAAEMADRFGAPPSLVANLLGIVRIKTEAQLLGFESITFRDAQVIFKLRRIANVDRVGLYRRFRNEATVALGEVKIPRRRFAEEPTKWIAEVRDLLPIIVGRSLPQPASASASGGALGANGASPDLAGLPQSPATFGTRPTS